MNAAPRIARRTLQSATASKNVFFSGIQPTGTPHLGNYLGALSNWKRLQDTAQPNDEIYYCIVGWHAVTMPQDPAKLRLERRDMMAALLATGLDPDRCTIFHQDQVLEHVELGWLLMCQTPVGHLRRMTQWKDKVLQLRNLDKNTLSNGHDEEAGLRLGLLAYPVLQAADILLYDTTHVPVGHDQTQHIELARDIAQRFNKDHKSKLFTLPQGIYTQISRVLSLNDPTSKMSKSNPNSKSRILLTDSPSEIKSKMKSAATDSILSLSYDPENRKGVSNLMSIYAALSPDGFEHGQIAEKYNSAASPYASFKSDLSDILIATLTPIREEYNRLRQDQAYLAAVEEKGRQKAQAKAQQTIAKVRQTLGLE